MKKIHASLLGLILQFSTYAHALSNYEGIVLVEENKRSVLTASSSRPLEIHALNPQVKIDILRLTSGDYINFNGEISQKTMHIRSVNFVGLTYLIGTWRSLDRSYFNFVNFTDMHLYLPNNKFKSKFIWGKYNYNIVPGKNDTWTIFIVNDESILIGRIYFTKTSLQFEMINTDTGEIEKIYDLTKTIAY